MVSKKVIFEWLGRQKLTNTQLLCLHGNLGITVPSKPRKIELMEQLAKQLSIPINKPEMVISLDIGVKNMAMSRFNWKGTDCELQQSVKFNLNSTDLEFNPLNWSHITMKFLFDQILKPIDDDVKKITILVERQRFRTGGGFNVLENTIQANTIESMIYMGAVMWNELLGKREKRIEIRSFSPATMVNYWESLIVDGDIKEELKTLKSKDLRIGIVLQLLNESMNKEFQLNDIPKFINRNDDCFKLSNNVLSQIHDVKTWKIPWKYKSRSRKIFEVMAYINEINLNKYKIERDQWGVKKGDDLADSILYGLTYWDYQRHRIDLVNSIENNESFESLSFI